MPLARIVAPLAEFYDRLAQDLRAQGFDVQNAHSGQFFPENADLEITVKQCAPEEASKLVFDASAGKDMCVLVNPSGRQGKVRSIEMIVVQPRELQTEQVGISPAQVIEISTAMCRSVEAPSPKVVPPQVVRSLTQGAAKSAHSTWSDIARTSSRWLDAAGSTCQSGWQKLKHVFLPVRAYFWEIGEETRKICRRAAQAVISRAKASKDRTEDEQLVPSMFQLNEPEAVASEEKSEIINHEVVVQMPERRARRFAGPDLRFVKVASAAAVVAVAALLAASVMRRAPQAPAAASQPAADSRAAAPVSAGVKPSALTERGNEHKPSPVQMVSAHQPAREENGVEDTVVRYGRHAPAPARRTTPYEIKHYSDLD